MTILEQISHDAMAFMRGRYRLDEVGDGKDEARRQEMIPPLIRMYGITDWSMRCSGCESDACHCKGDPCHAKACAASRGLAKCRDCSEHPCIRATTSDHLSMIHTQTHDAEEITWGILPYVPGQYGN